MKEKIRKEYYRRIKLVLKSELSAGYKITTINMLAVPVLNYSFNIIDWQLQKNKENGQKNKKAFNYIQDEPSQSRC